MFLSMDLPNTISILSLFIFIYLLSVWDTNKPIKSGGNAAKIIFVWGVMNKLDAVLLTFHSALRKLNTEPSIGASHRISVHLTKQFQRRKILKISQSETRVTCGSHGC